jgi:transcriptional regulator with XRE-family HTH domain
MQIHQLFKQAMDEYRVNSKDLAALAGISQNHLSQFRSGKKWISPEVFIALLQSMDRLSPGSRRYFCQMLAEEPLSKEENNNRRLVEMVENADDEEIDAVLLAIGRKCKKTRQNMTISDGYQPNFDSAIAV